ncbi:hypothetical protein [Roseisolibacter agri]|uniref:Uncharacterized protein n=1 Tax=Roseisolibacter agri TaxID=2014610 RepID=A0AA37Q9N6_9BACT|nr:hypothetical protein [Roseisolibacter agri]GLC25651.1 hypothetical protein rosag_21640 [Roseisolibacter agri]
MRHDDVGGGRASRARRARSARATRTLLATLLVMASPAAGCRSYAPVTPGDGNAGRVVRVRLTPDGGSALASTIGPRGTALEGTLVTADDSTVTMDVRAVTREGGDDERWPAERLRVARRGVAGVDVVRTSVKRSALLAGGVVAGLLLLRAALGGSESVVRVPGGGSGGGR